MPAPIQRILIVDDDAHVRFLFQDSLALQGYDAVAVADADQASRLLAQQQFDLVILDIMMPGKSGLQFLPELLAQYSDTAVLMSTSLTDISVAVKAVQDGAYDYITKPVHLESLNLHVARALERRSLIIRQRQYKEALEDMVTRLTNEVELRNHEIAELRSFVANKLGDAIGPQDAYKFLEDTLNGLTASLEHLADSARKKTSGNGNGNGR